MRYKILISFIIVLIFINPAHAGFQTSDAPIYSVPTGRTSFGTYSASETIRVTATIAPLFNLTVEVMGGGDSLNFGTIKEGESPERKELVIGMATNLRLPYQIIQEAVGPLENDRGDAIPDDYFTCISYGDSGNKTEGKFGAVVPTSVTKGPVVLFVSDIEGSQDYFTVGYDVTPPKGQPYGAYKTAIVFTATLL